jgi:hypothetical protein
MISIFEPRMYIHKQLNIKCVKEKCRKVGVMSLHHSQERKKVSSNDG